MIRNRVVQVVWTSTRGGYSRARWI